MLALRPRKITRASPQVRPLSDKAEVLGYLNRQRAFSATAISHLEEPLFADSRWAVAEEGGRYALCLLSSAFPPSYLFMLGDVELVALLLDSRPFPGRTFITCAPEHLAAIREHYELKTEQTLMRMVVTRSAFVPKPGDALRLTAGQVHDLNQLYRADGFSFSARQVRRGIYYGVWQEGQLVAVAGTHMISPTQGIAYLGNVLTHPWHRNLGLATICTSAVTQELLETCDEVVLNVEPDNSAAIEVYEKLGYRREGPIVEAMGWRRTFFSRVLGWLLGSESRKEEKG